MDCPILTVLPQPLLSGEQMQTQVSSFLPLTPLLLSGICQINGINNDNNAYNALTFATGASEAMRIDTSGNLLFNSGYGSAAIAYGCRAWVNFNGTGTVAIRASGNVSSITDNNTGNYSINFTTAMTDANYSGSFCGNGLAQIPVFYVTSTSSLQVLYYNTAGTPVDNSVCVASVFR